MRRVVDVAAVLMAVGMISAISWAIDGRMKSYQAVQKVASETERFRQMIAMRAAGSNADLNPRGWPKTIDPSWFTEGPPRNTLVTPERPWVEIATEDEAQLSNPMIRMTVNPSLASFWYNPYQGIVRARVPVTISDREALDWYNTINGTNLDSIYTHDSLVGAPAGTGTGAEAGAKPAAMTAVDEAAVARAAQPETVSVPEAPSPKP